MTVTISFRPNEWFTNEHLTFTAVQNIEETNTVEIRGTVIDWKEGKDVRKKTIKKTQKNRKTGETRVITKVVD